MTHKNSVVIFAGFLIAAIGSASAKPTGLVSACTTYASASSYGTETFPGTYVGAVGSGAGEVCQIGSLAMYNGGTGGALDNANGHDPSIYEFYWGGGTLGITEQTGNNGYPNSVDVTVYSLASQDATSPGTEIGSINIAYTSGPSLTETVIAPELLGAGYYAIEDQLAAAEDPNYQVNFAGTPAVAATPEPGSITLLGSGMLALAAALRRRSLATPDGGERLQ
jgi:hypothetical protein